MADLQQKSMSTRRGVLLGAGGLGVGAIVTACGGKESSESRPSSGAQTSSSAASGGAGTTSAAPQGIKTSGIPVDGGTVFKAENTVVTQPKAGQFKAFDATCTHQGCTVGSVSDGTINCPCHGSKYSITDGSVVNGPATRPLAAKTVTVNGDTLTVS
jgi:Rieske Fe-S protein